jgi:pimeloyl-ACP methyl ester carboxylesterase
MTSPSPVGRWWDTTYGAVAVRITPPDVASRSVVLLVPALGYESSSSYRTLRAAAESLAAQGHVAVRVELPGTGDAAGPTGPHRLETLVGSLVESVDALRAAGAEQVSVVGLRAGATVALLAAARRDVDGLALWATAAGKRHRRELSLMGVGVPETESATAPAGSVVIGGWLFPTPLLDDLAAVDLTTARVAPGTRVLVLDREDRPAQDALADALRSGGATVTSVQVGRHDRFLDRPSEDSEIGVEAVAVLAGWYADELPAIASPERLVIPGSPSIEIPWRAGDHSGTVIEDFVHLGEHDLAAVLTHGATPSRDVVLLLNTGSDPHSGPGRAWVEYSRSLALAGQDVARLDFRGWGDSPHLESATGRPYDLHHGDDTLSAADALRARGYERVVLAGLCAGAWVALDVARHSRVDAVLALNAQLYWARGDAIEALMSTTRVRRLPEIAEIRRRAEAGEWDRADESGDRPPAARWLDELAERGVPVSLVFAEGDDGVEYLQDRLGRRIADLSSRGVLRLREVAGIDHSMSRVWLRPAMLDVLAEETAALLAARD